MRKAWRFVAAGLVMGALAACGGGGAPAPGDDPVATVERIYEPYVAQAANAPAAERAAPWTDDLKAQLDAARAAEGGLNFNPVIDGQEFEIADLDVALDGPPSQSTATVRAGFTNLGEPTTVFFDLVREDDGWRVHDVHTEAWALRAILADVPAAQTPPEGVKR